MQHSAGRQGPAQPSPAVLPGPSLSLPLFLACVKVSPVCQPASQSVSQAGSQSISRSARRAVIHSFALSRIHLASPSSRRTSRTGLVPGKKVHAHCTLGLPHCARPSLPPCLHLPPKPAHTLLACCTLHLAPCYHPTSFLPFACWLCVCVCVLLMCACACACVSMGDAVLN